MQRLARRVTALVLLAVAALAITWIIRGRPAHRPAATAPQSARIPDPPGIILHASMTPGRVNGKPIDAAWLERIHAEDHPKWATEYEGVVYHIGYHYVILPNGTVQKGRPDHCIGCHAPHFNTWLGICLIGCFDPAIGHHWKPSRPTVAQIAALINLCERLMSEYHIPPERILRHLDTKKTWCPGRRFPYRTVMARLRKYAAAHPETSLPARSYATVHEPPAAAAAGDGR
jgi:N-acetylmuramoyl-L-alanine amidase